MDFKNRIEKVVKSISKGRVMSYKEVAIKAGYPKAYRAVGSIMRRNRNKEIPCHRVVCSNGYVGQFNRGGTSKKVDLLKSEKVKINSRNNIIQE